MNPVRERSTPPRTAPRLEQRTIAAGRLSLTRLGLGAAPLGNLYRAISDEQARRTVEAAFAAGMRYVDTAPYYGFGLSEQRVGDAVRAQRSRWQVSTKVGRLLRPHAGEANESVRDGFAEPLPFEAYFDYSYAGILRSFEESLHRLGLARVDLLLVHDIGAATHGAQHAATYAQLTQGGGFRALEELRASGVIGGFGLGVNEYPVALKALEDACLDVVLLAGRYTLLDQSALAEFLPACEREGVAVIAAGVFNSGVLATGSASAGTAYYNYVRAPPEIISRVA